MIKFLGRFATLKNLGFDYKLIHDRQGFYTTWETGSASDVWIRKAGRYITFDGYNHTTSSNILKYLIENNFVMPFSGLSYDGDTYEVEAIAEDDWFMSISTDGTKIRIMLKAGTLETLKKMNDAGLLAEVE